MCNYFTSSHQALAKIHTQNELVKLKRMKIEEKIYSDREIER